MSVCSCVKGSMPKVGDKVMVEASYNANMPFKWNAVCVQLLTGRQVSVIVTELLAANSHSIHSHVIDHTSTFTLISVNQSQNV